MYCLVALLLLNSGCKNTTDSADRNPSATDRRYSGGTGDGYEGKLFPYYYSLTESLCPDGSRVDGLYERTSNGLLQTRKNCLPVNLNWSASQLIYSAFDSRLVSRENEILIGIQNPAKIRDLDAFSAFLVCRGLGDTLTASRRIPVDLLLTRENDQLYLNLFYALSQSPQSAIPGDLHERLDIKVLASIHAAHDASPKTLRYTTHRVGGGTNEPPRITLDVFRSQTTTALVGNASIEFPDQSELNQGVHLDCRATNLLEL